MSSTLCCNYGKLLAQQGINVTTLIKSFTTIVISAALISPVQATEIKNIILMIGDGMGPQQVSLFAKALSFVQ